MKRQGIRSPKRLLDRALASNLRREILRFNHFFTLNHLRQIIEEPPPVTEGLYLLWPHLFHDQDGVGVLVRPFGRVSCGCFERLLYLAPALLLQIRGWQLLRGKAAFEETLERIRVRYQPRLYGLDEQVKVASPGPGRFDPLVLLATRNDIPNMLPRSHGAFRVDEQDTQVMRIRLPGVLEFVKCSSPPPTPDYFQ